MAGKFPGHCSFNKESLNTETYRGTASQDFKKKCLSHFKESSGSLIPLHRVNIFGMVHQFSGTYCIGLLLG